MVASFLITFLFPGIATSINMHVPLLLSQIMMFGLLLGIVLSAHFGWFHNMVTSTSWLVLNDFGAWSYQCLLSNFTPVFLHMLQCSWTHTLSFLFMYCSVANIGHYYYYYYYLTIMTNSITMGLYLSMWSAECTSMNEWMNHISGH